jgi:hypothetical protein
MANLTGKGVRKNKANWVASFKFESCRGRPPCLPIQRAATGGRPYASRTSHSAEGRSCETNPIGGFDPKGIPDWQVVRTSVA